MAANYDVLQLIGPDALQQLKDANTLATTLDKQLTDLSKTAKGIEFKLGSSTDIKTAVTNTQALVDVNGKLVGTYVQVSKAAEIYTTWKEKSNGSTEKEIAGTNKIIKLKEAEEKAQIQLNKAAFEAEKIRTQAARTQEAKNKADLAHTNNLIAQKREQERLAKVEEQRAASAKKLADAEADSAAKQQQKAAAANIANDSLKKLSATLEQHRKSYYLLTQAERENANIGGVLRARIQELDSQLKLADSSIGRFQRSVGNYGGATAGLRTSFQQIARELPSISNGFATFASAIGNNIAPAQDALRAFIAEQKALKAQGLPTTSVLSAVAGSIFNVQTALLLAVTALTVYGKEIGEFIFGTKKATEANKDFADSLDDLNDKIEFGSSNLDKAAKLRIAQAKARGADDKEIAAIEQVGYKDRLAKQEAFIKESIDNEIYYSDLLTKVQGGIKLKTKDGAILKEEDLAKNLEAARKQTVKLREQAKAIESDAEVAALEALAPKKTRAKREKDLTDEFRRLRALMQEFSLSLANPEKSELDSILADIQKQVDSSDGKIELKAVMKISDDQLSKDIANAQAETNRALLGVENSFQAGLYKTTADYEQAKIKAVQDGADKQSELRIAALKNILRYLPQFGTEYAAVQAQIEEAELERQRRHNDKKLANEKTYAESRAALIKQIGNAQQDLGESTIGAVQSVIQSKLAAYTHEADERIRLIEKQKQAEIEQINASMQTSEEKRAAIAAIEAKATADTAVQEKERRKLIRQSAIAERTAILLKLTADTLQKVAAIKAQAAVLSLNPVTAPLAALALAQIPYIIGSGAVAAVGILAAKLPEYRTGTPPGGHPADGLAVVGDGYQSELKIAPDGATSWTPAVPTIDYLEKGTHILPPDKVADMARMYNVRIGGSATSEKGINLQEVVNGLDAVQRTIRNKQEVHVNITEGGWNWLIQSGQSIQQHINKNVKW